MAKTKDIKDKIIEYCERLVETEKDKWNSGMTNQYYRACELRDIVESAFERK